MKMNTLIRVHRYSVLYVSYSDQNIRILRSSYFSFSFLSFSFQSNTVEHNIKERRCRM